MNPKQPIMWWKWGLLGVGILLIVGINLRTLWEHRDTNHSQTPLSPQDTHGIIAWGTGQDSQARPQLNVVDFSQIKITQVAGGIDHVAFLTESNDVWSVGRNTHGEMGGTQMEFGGLTKAALPEGLKVKKIVAGQSHTLILTEDGQVYSWGLNLSGQLGNGKNTDESVPYLIENLEHVVDIAAGYRFSVAVQQNGTVWAWGTQCDRSQIKDFDLFLANLGESLAQNGGYFDGMSQANELHQINDCLGEEPVHISSRLPKQIQGVEKIRQVSAGYGHILALDEAGQVWAWGCNKYGQIATGDAKNTESTKYPGLVKLPIRALQVSAGFRHSMVLLENGTVYTWGHNSFGELGLGHVTDMYMPIKVEGLDKAKMIAADHDISWVITENEELWGFGENQFKLLKETDELVISQPVQVQELNKIRAVASGATYAVGIN